jgi:23S rRNA G2445 N2-methylase RlmL
MGTYFARCTPGLEDISQRELLGYGVKSELSAAGLLRFESNAAKVSELLKRVRTVDDFYFSSSPSKWTEGMCLPFERRRGGLLEIQHLDGSVRRLERVGLKPLYLRDYRIFNHPSALRPTVAASLVMLTDMRGDLLDPFAGGGTIVIEDALMMLSGDESEGRSASHRLCGIDISRHHLSGAEKNASAAGVRDSIELRLADATRVSFERPFSRVVTNPPFGVRGAKLQRILSLYDRFVKNLDRIISTSGQGVIITSEWAQLKRMLKGRGYRVEGVRRVRHGRLWTGVVIFRC